MKIVTTQSDLSTALSAVAKAIPNRPSHPVLGCFYLSASRSAISVRGFDLRLGIEYNFDADVAEEGEIAIQARPFLDIVSRIPDEEVTLTTTQDPNDDDEPGVITLTSTSGRFQFHTMRPDDFPAFPVSDVTAVEVDAHVFARGVSAVEWSASTEETKQVLTGVQVWLRPDSLELAATDGHRLSVFKDYETGAENEIQIVVPAQAMREIRNAIKQQNPETFVLKCSSTHMEVQIGDRTLITTRLIEGAYPPYWQLIPQQFKGNITLDRGALKSAIVRLSVLANARNNVIRMECDRAQHTVAFAVEAQDVGAGREFMGATISEDPPELIAYNVKYLIDVVSAMQSNEVTFHLNGPTQPVIITPLSGEKLTILTMPVQLRD